MGNVKDINKLNKQERLERIAELEKLEESGLNHKESAAALGRQLRELEASLAKESLIIKETVASALNKQENATPGGKVDKVLQLPISTRGQLIGNIEKIKIAFALEENEARVAATKAAKIRDDILQEERDFEVLQLHQALFVEWAALVEAAESFFNDKVIPLARTCLEGGPGFTARCVKLKLPVLFAVAVETCFELSTLDSISMEKAVEDIARLGTIHPPAIFKESVRRRRDMEHFQTDAVIPMDKFGLEREF